MKVEFTKTQLETIFDVINVYDPGDIAHVYPEMGTPEFVQQVTDVFRKMERVIERVDYEQALFEQQSIPLEAGRGTIV